MFLVFLLVFFAHDAMLHSQAKDLVGVVLGVWVVDDQVGQAGYAHVQTKQRLDQN